MVMIPAVVRSVVAAVVLPALVVLIAPDASAQGGITFDQAVQGAFARNCERMGGSAGNYGAGIGTPSSTLSMCPTAAGTVSGASGGSITAGTSQGVQDEERRLLQRLKAKRDGENGGAPGASADSQWTLQGLSVFASGEFEALEKRFTKFEPAYSSDSWGGTLGVDYAIARWVVAGIAFNYAHADGDFRRSSGGFDTDSYGPLVYAGFVPARNVFVDVFAGYSRKDYVINREVSAAGPTGNGFVERRGFAVGETSGDQYTVGLNAGYDFIIRNLTVGPRAGMNYRFTTIDGFAERGRRARACLDGICSDRPTTGLELAYDRQEETSLTTTVGLFASLAISTGFGVLIPQGTFEYVHEFQDNQRDIRFRVVDDLQRHKFSFNNDPPDRDHFYTSIGVALVLPGGFSPFINYRTLLGYSDYSKHTVTAGLRFSF